MTLASLGWATWWIVLLARAVAPERAEASLAVPAWIACFFAVLGLGAAALTLRARRAWMLFVLVPLFANASLLLVPWIVSRFLASA